VKGLKYLRDKKFILNVATVVAIGIVILLASNVLFKPGGQTAAGSGTADPASTTAVSQINTSAAGAPAASTDDYAAALTSQLQDVLSAVDGVGRVKVMLTLESSKELVVAEDSSSKKSDSAQTDAQGGTSTSSGLDTSSSKVILKASDGSEQPLVVKEIEPKVAGVVIVAEGGGNIIVKDALVRAAQTVLNIGPDKIQVLKAK